MRGIPPAAMTQPLVGGMPWESALLAVLNARDGGCAAGGRGARRPLLSPGLVVRDFADAPQEGGVGRREHEAIPEADLLSEDGVRPQASENGSDQQVAGDRPQAVEHTLPIDRPNEALNLCNRPGTGRELTRS